MNGKRDEERAVPLEVVRETLRQVVNSTSLRTVAEYGGAGKSALHAFLAGKGVPALRTQRALQALYWNLAGRERERFAETEALRVLTEHLPATAVDRVREGIVAFVAAETLALGAELPGWMRE